MPILDQRNDMGKHTEYGGSCVQFRGKGRLARAPKPWHINKAKGTKRRDERREEGRPAGVEVCLQQRDRRLHGRGRRAALRPAPPLPLRSRAIGLDVSPCGSVSRSSPSRGDTPAPP